jgi:hypothetical protein
MKRLNQLNQNHLSFHTSVAAIDVALPETIAPAVVTAAAEPAAGVQQHPLFEWVRQNNGYVHPALAVVDTAPCGCRGVVAVSDVSMPAQQQPEGQALGWPAAQQPLPQQQQQQLPLIALPEQLYMKTDDALDILGAAIMKQQQQQDQLHQTRTTSLATPAGILQQLLSSFRPQQQQQQLVESLQRLQPPLLLALLLAYERSKGPGSFWYPYIASLPDEPPCGWFAALQQQQQQQQQSTPDAVAAAAAAVLAKCRAAAAIYGPALGGCICTTDVVWAYGQVVSRSFGDGRGMGMAPLIDMLNHKLVRNDSYDGVPELHT